MVLRSTESLLLALGYDTVTVNEADAVLATIRAERPDVVLQDVRMPGLDVEALLTDIRQDPLVSRTPVVLFSASMDLHELQVRVKAAGALEKPFKPHEAIAAIDRATG